MCYIDTHEKQNPSSFHYVISSGGNALPSNSTTEALVSLSETIDFIDFWVQFLEQNLLERSNMYFETMKNMFQKIPDELPNALINKEKRQSLFHAIGGDWYMNKFNEKILPLKKKETNKKISIKGG